MNPLRLLLKLLPKNIRSFIISHYHLFLSYLGAVVYGHPSHDLIVIGVTGTKGKSTTTELIYRILTEAGKKVAMVGTIRFVIDGKEEKNLFKMTMPGRLFIQSFLARAKKAGCTYAVIEMTSEGAQQFRHRGIEMNALVFTNLSPEHIESHGSFENYLQAKLLLAKQVSVSKKRPRILVSNIDDEKGAAFLAFDAEIKRPYSISEAVIKEQDSSHAKFSYKGTEFMLPLPGVFNIKNALAAIEVCDAFGIPPQTSSLALRKVERIPGRAEKIAQGQPFEVIVDYAHTPDSLRAIYEAFPPVKNASGKTTRRICVLGNTGGGRDTWKRPVMGAIADELCDIAYLTDEDSYDEDLLDILSAMKQGFKRITPQIVQDRREAIHSALQVALPGDTVIISGKGTDPYIMGKKGNKLPWSDALVAREELLRLKEGKK